jgi:hypothetical protein
MLVSLIQNSVQFHKPERAPSKEVCLKLQQLCISVVSTLRCFQRTVKQTLVILVTVSYVATKYS